MAGPDVVLVGVIIPGAENHSLSILSHAGRDEGLDVTVLPFAGWRDIPRIVAFVTTSPPRVFGVSLQTTEAALVTMALCRSVRRAGFAGRIVCGGHFATLNARAILESAACVDAVVRFAGVRALPELVHAMNDTALASVPGLLFRGRDREIHEGAPADLDDAWFLSRSVASRILPRHLGFPAADLVTSRGCEHRCTYCCVAGTELLATDERRRHDRPLRSRRVPEIDAVADEIASLYHEHAARVFNFMDDNVIPDRPAASAAWAEQLGQALAHRGVGRIAATVQVRADAIDERAAESLAQIGIVRAYVGVDGYSAGQLRNLGRRACASSGPRGLAELTRRGIFCVANALLVGPTMRWCDVEREIEGIAAVTGAPVHLLRIDVRAGTAYDRRARSLGLVEGGFLWPHFRFADVKAQQFAELILSVPARLETRSVPIALYDLGYNLGLARRLLPDLDLHDATATYARITQAWNAEQVRFLRASHRAVSSGREQAIVQVREETRALTETLDAAWIAECDRAIEAIARQSAPRGIAERRAYARGRLLSAAALSMSLAACGPRDRIDEPTSSSGTAAASTDGSSSTTGTLVCDDPRLEARPAEDLQRWFISCIPECSGAWVRFDDHGVAVEFGWDTGEEVPPDLLDCLLELFAGSCYPSLAGATVPLMGHCWIA